MKIQKLVLMFALFSLLSACGGPQGQQGGADPANRNPRFDAFLSKTHGTCEGDNLAFLYLVGQLEIGTPGEPVPGGQGETYPVDLVIYMFIDQDGRYEVIAERWMVSNEANGHQRDVIGPVKRMKGTYELSSNDMVSFSKLGWGDASKGGIVVTFSQQSIDPALEGKKMVLMRVLSQESPRKSHREAIEACERQKKEQQRSVRPEQPRTAIER